MRNEVDVRMVLHGLCNLGCRSSVPPASPRYETTNHLWLILEYCVGGDLLSLLRQDVKLPETSVHDFARDLVVAMQVGGALVDVPVVICLSVLPLSLP